MCSPQIIDYTIAEGRTPVTLASSVIKLIEDGFEPFGSMGCNDGWYYQPMVLYARPEAPEPPLLTN